MNSGDIVRFDVAKNFTYIKPLGFGGTGDTHLLKDETTNICFAVKKYVPKDVDRIEENYSRFVDEIKILFNIYHPNIVRIYNYYLYPQQKTGYLQMEYIHGSTIDEYDVSPFSKSWDELFAEAVSAFEYLEDRDILHRDIRPANILIDDNNTLKIIDFGFSKKIDDYQRIENSILLNWPATEMPDEVTKDWDYNEQTEIYFLGNLFKHIIKEKSVEFSYNHVVQKMTETSPRLRYKSFHEVMNDIREGVLIETGFTDEEKIIYQEFADDLTNHIFSFDNKFTPITHIPTIISRLSELIRSSSLEDYVQDVSTLILCFVENGFNYNNTPDIKVETIKNFYSMIIQFPEYKQQILFANLYNRLSAIRVKVSDDDLPF